MIGQRRVTYRELDTTANRLAHVLRARGVRHGDRVATLAPNRAEYPAIYFACAKLGAIHVPVNFRFRAGEVRYVLAQSEASVLLHADEYADTVGDIRDALPALRHVVSLDHDLPALLAQASPAEFSANPSAAMRHP